MMFKCFVLLLNLIIGILAGPYAHFRKLENVDITLDVYIAEYTDIQIIACLAKCTPIKICIYISYHESQNVCRIHGINRNGIRNEGWRIYFKVSDEGGRTELDLMNGATASQSSTYAIATADLALDGNYDTNYYKNSCSHTNSGYSYWIMRFGMSGVVDKVDIYMRSDQVRLGRNTNRIVMVAQSYDDAVNNVGTECGRYFGPPIVTPPYILTIQCGGQIFGKFLRITHESSKMMDQCEEVASRFSIGKASTHKLVQDHLGMNKVSGGWLPTQLTEYFKESRAHNVF